MFRLVIAAETVTKTTMARAMLRPACASSRYRVTASTSQTSAWIRSAAKLSRTKVALATRFAVVAAAVPGFVDRHSHDHREGAEDGDHQVEQARRSCESNR